MFFCNNTNHICMYIFICLFVYCFHRHFHWGWETDSSLPGLMAWKGRTGMIMKAFKKMLCVQVYRNSEEDISVSFILSPYGYLFFWVSRKHSKQLFVIVACPKDVMFWTEGSGQVQIPYIWKQPSENNVFHANSYIMIVQQNGKNIIKNIFSCWSQLFYCDKIQAKVFVSKGTCYN